MCFDMPEEAIIQNGLNSCAVFDVFNPGEKIELSKYATLLVRKPDEEVFPIDGPGDAFYIIASGCLLLRLRNRKKKKLWPGNIFGEVAMFDERRRTGSITVIEQAQLIQFNKSQLFENNGLDIEFQLKIVLALARHMVTYFDEDIPLSARELVRRGESETVEFKKSDAHVHYEKIIETVAAMMNAKGGTILLGVEDDGRPVGLKFRSNLKDLWTLRLEQQISQRLGKAHVPLAHVETEIVDNKHIVRIDCDPSPVPVLMTEKIDGREMEILFVRTNRENICIRKLSDYALYLDHRFKEGSKFVRE